MPVEFPEDFVWGASTSAYQIEGATGADGRGPSIWDTFVRVRGAIYHGENADFACDHYNRLEADLDLIALLGLKAYRFSIAWPRVQPDGRSANPAGLDFYDRLVDGLLAPNGMPIATLYHWDLPQALQDRGGWAQPAAPEWLPAHPTVVFRRLGDRGVRWV